MFLQKSRGVFILRLFWRSGLRPSSFLRKQVFWKSAVHQLLNHSVTSRAGAAGPEWGFTLSKDQCPVWAWPECGRRPGTEGRVLGKGSPPTHTICFSALGLWSADCGGGENSLSRPVCKRNSSRSSSGWRQPGGGREADSVGAHGGLGVSADRCFILSLSQASSFVSV